MTANWVNDEVMIKLGDYKVRSGFDKESCVTFQNIFQRIHLFANLYQLSYLLLGVLKFWLNISFIDE